MQSYTFFFYPTHLLDALPVLVLGHDLDLAVVVLGTVLDVHAVEVLVFLHA